GEAADQSPLDRARQVAAATSRVRAAGLRPAGAYVTQAECEAVANSRGLFAAHRSSHAGFALTAMSDDASGWAERTARTPAGVDVGEAAAVAIDKAVRGRAPIDLEPGDYTVVLEPAAMTDVLLFLGYAAF